MSNQYDLGISNSNEITVDGVSFEIIELSAPLANTEDHQDLVDFLAAFYEEEQAQMRRNLGPQKKSGQTVHALVHRSAVEATDSKKGRILAAIQIIQDEDLDGVKNAHQLSMTATHPAGEPEASQAPATFKAALKFISDRNMLRQTPIFTDVSKQDEQRNALLLPEIAGEVFTFLQTKGHAHLEQGLLAEKGILIFDARGGEGNEVVVVQSNERQVNGTVRVTHSIVNTPFPDMAEVREKLIGTYTKEPLADDEGVIFVIGGEDYDWKSNLKEVGLWESPRTPFEEKTRAAVVANPGQGVETSDKSTIA